MYHMFDVDIAVEYGVNAAILFHNIAFWCAKNKANGHNHFDGKYWTYNSRSAFTELFPYLSERQVKTAIDKLVDGDMVVTGNYNKDRRDRSLWYALTEKGWYILQNRPLHYAEMSNANGEHVRPLPDITPDIKQDIYISSKPNKTDSSPGFDEFWKAYPRNVAKHNALKAWAKLKPDAELQKTILTDVQRRKRGEWDGKDVQYIPHPATYLNQRRWEDEPAKEPEDAPTERRGRTLAEIMAISMGEYPMPKD